MRSIVVTPMTPSLGSGLGLRTYGIVRALAAAGPVDLVYAQFGDREPAAAYGRVDGLTMHRVEPSRGLRRLVAYLRARRRGAPDGFARGASPELAAAAERLAGVAGDVRLVADGPIAAVALLPLAARRAAVYNAHNLESAFRASIEAGGDRTTHRLRRFEERLLRTYAETWMVSPPDVRGARELAPGARVEYVPNVIDVAAIAPRDDGGSGGERILFVGDFTYEPNRQGFRWLAAEVMPRLWQRIPGARLELVGRGLERPDGLDERIAVRGFVDDLEAEYDAAACAAVPLLTGGGSPLKFVEALAHAVPVVATPVAAAGLEVEAGRDYLEGADADGFADALATALGGGAGAVAAAGRSLVEREYSIEALAGRLNG